MAEPANALLQSLASELSGEPCTVGDLVTALLRRMRGSGFGAGTFSDPSSGARGFGAGRPLGRRPQPSPTVDVVGWPPRSPIRSVADWFAEAESMFVSGASLDEPTTIIGLALADRASGREVVRAGIFALIEHGFPDGLRHLLSDRGKERLETIPLLAVPNGAAATMLDHGSDLRAAALSPDGRRAVTFGREIRLWSLSTGVELARVRPPRPVRAARFAPDARSVVALLADWSVFRWSARSADQGELAFPPRPDLAGATLCRDGSAAVFRARAWAEGLTVLDFATGRTTSVAPGPRTGWVAISPKADLLAVVVAEQIRVFQRSAGGFEEAASVEFTPVVSFDCGAGVVVAATGDSVEVVHPSAGPIVGVVRPARVALNTAGTAVAVAHADGLLLFHPVTGAELARLPASGGAQRLTFSLDDRRLVTARPDGTAWVWDVGVDPPPAPPPPSIYAADRADDARDLLDRSHDVEAFASLIAARSVEAPLSIGVFGDWGSGKSWFMGQLRQRVAEVAADAAASCARQRDITFFKHIAQVEFNAWHYAEGDVLASLVDHIFTRLDVGEGGAGIVKDEQARRLKALAEAQLQTARAEKKVEEAATELAVVEGRLREREELRRAKLAELEASTPQAVSESAGKLATEALEAIGWGRVPEAVADLRNELGTARDELVQAKGLLAPLVLGKRNDEWAFVLLALGPAAALVAGVIAAILSTDTRAMLSGFAGLVVGGLGGLTAFIRRQTAWLRARREQITAAQAHIDKEIADKLAAVDRDIATLRAEEVQKREVVDQARATFKEQQEVVARREEELALARPEKLLEDLIRATVRAGEYARRLGIVAQARRDFEKVSDMIRAVNADLDRARDLDAEKDVQINRIVLYIDDLDRCEPEKVVQVLQAVHLLLAFPLFVVVVGVDSRWVGRALRKQYPELLEAGGATPHDYLEKIFQIPFWLDPLDVGRTRQMLRGLAAVTPDRTGAPEGPTVAQPVAAPAASSDEGEATEATALTSVARATPPERVAGSRELNPRGLELQPAELEAMEQLAEIVGRSPRALKRFVNVYRLIKVRAPEPLDFVDPARTDADYRIVLGLLAMVTGRPDQAIPLFDTIRKAPDDQQLRVPDGWPATAGPYKRWVDDVARFSFHVTGGARPASAGPASPDGQK